MQIPHFGKAAARNRVIAEIHAECERGRNTLWVDSRWLEHLTYHEIEAIVMEYGFGPLTPSNRPRREVLKEMGY